MIRRFGAIASVVVVLTLTGTGLAAAKSPKLPTAPKGDAFYRGPKKLPSGKPGTLVWVQSIAAPTGAHAWRVLYKSQSVAGRDIMVSGTIVAPKGKAPKGGRPVVTWAHGTSGLADVCAPSKLDGASKAIPWIDRYLEAGYVVTATDYEGLGTVGLHPYLVGESEGRGVIDIVRAARKIKGVGASKRMLIFGHSQGGHGALFAGQLAPVYAPELKLVGVAAAAPAAELKLLLGAAANVPSFLGYVTMGARGFGAAYPEAQTALATVFTPQGLRDSEIVHTQCSEAVGKVMSRSSAEVIARNPLDTPPFPTLIDENTPANVKTAAPMLVVQGDKDALVIPGTTDSFATRACGTGDTLEYRKYPGADHARVMIDSQADVLAWMADRWAGKPAPTTC